LVVSVNEAENLVTRALQSKYGVPITRQVSIGPKFLVDGAFIQGDRIGIIEVKYVATPTAAGRVVEQTIRRLKARVEDLKTDGVDLVVAVVVKSERDLLNARMSLNHYVADPFSNVRVELFSLDDLRRRFRLRTPAETDPDFRSE